MSKRLIIRKKDKFLDQTTYFELFDDFINDSLNGYRRKNNGTRISEGSVRKYHYLKKKLEQFCKHNQHELIIYLVNYLTQKEKNIARRYYINFYENFTSFLYNLGLFDNYVGTLIKILKSFFHYLEKERNISIGIYFKSFYVPKEDIQIVTLSFRQINYMIHNEKFNTLLQGNNLD